MRTRRMPNQRPRRRQSLSPYMVKVFQRQSSEPFERRNAHVDQNKVPNNLRVSTQGIGGSCGR
jgi:hypothetical protein